MNSISSILLLQSLFDILQHSPTSSRGKVHSLIHAAGKEHAGGGGGLTTTS